MSMNEYSSFAQRNGDHIPITTRMPHRRGAMMIYLTILVPVIMGALALVLDVGLSMTTARQMQSATDHGAIEGLRLRDSGQSEFDQRTAVADAMKRVFDDDLNPANGDKQNFGAGPVLTSLTAGRTSLNASETLDFDNPKVYDPDPALNLLTAGNNQPHGDMVSGWYFDSQRHDEGYNSNPYARDDFQPETVGGVAPGNAEEAFLVRMRRTSSYASAGYDNDPGVSTAGPPVPALFSRGTMTKDGELRSDGVTVRATSIAVAHRAMSMGPTIPQDLFGVGAPVDQVKGFANFAIDVDDWNDSGLFPVGVFSSSVQIDGLGSMEMDLGGGSTTAVGELHRTVQLAMAVNSADTQIVVRSAQGFNTPSTSPAASVPFNVRINDELLTVTAMSGGTGASATLWTVQRGEQGTSPTAHGMDDMVMMHEPIVFADSVEAVERPTGLGLAEVIGNTGTAQTFWVPIYSDQGGSVGRRVIGFGIATVDVIDADPATNEIQIRKEATMIGDENTSAIRTKRGFDATLTGTAGALDSLFTVRRTLDEPLRAPSLASAQSR